MTLKTFESALEVYFKRHPEVRDEYEHELERQMQGTMNDLDQDDQAQQDLD